MQVSGVLLDEKSNLMSMQLWEDTNLLPCDVFMQDLLVYLEDDNTITTVPGTPFTFVENPLENLCYQEFTEEQISWLVVESNLIDEKIVVSAGWNVSSSVAAVPGTAGRYYVLPVVRRYVRCFSAADNFFQVSSTRCMTPHSPAAVNATRTSASGISCR